MPTPLLPALAAKLPALPLRGVLLALCLLPALSMALLAGGLGAVMVHGTAERQAQERKQRVEHDLLLRIMYEAQELSVQATLVAERLTVVAALRDNDAAAAHRALRRAQASFASAGLGGHMFELIDATGRLLAGADERSGQSASLAPPDGPAGAPFIRAVDGRPMLAVATPVMLDGRLLGWLSIAMAFDSLPLSQMIGTASGAALRMGEQLINSTLLISEAELDMRLARMGGGRMAVITLGGSSLWVTRQPLPWTGPAIEVLLFWDVMELRRAGRVAVGMIVLSLLLVMALTLPVAAWVGARVADRLRDISGALLALTEGRRPELASGPAPPIAELRHLHAASRAFEASLRERELLTEKLRWLASFDSLTQLPNRTLFQDRLSQALAVTRRSGVPAALLCLDLDRFKEVNDTLGHAAGDELLRQVAMRIRLCLREVDTVARLGGDEFAVILAGTGRPQDCETMARRIIAAIEQPLLIGDSRVSVGVSIGIAIADATTDSAEDLLKDADLALYGAKAAGRGGWCFFSEEMNAKARGRRRLEAALRAALANGELHLLYQPQVALDDGKVIGAEALLRWTDRDGVTHSPAEFVPLAEDTGLIVPIGGFVLREACAFAATRPGLRIAVNVSAVQLRHPGFVADVRAALAASGLPPGMLELEMTETAAFDAGANSRIAIDSLRAIGVRWALDDFGTGYSSLGHLRELTVDRIKIDRSFVQNIAQDAQALAMVRAMVGMARAVGVGLVGEGVETAAQARALLAEGCAEGQGFMFGKPVTAEAFDRLRAVAA